MELESYNRVISEDLESCSRVPMVPLVVLECCIKFHLVLLENSLTDASKLHQCYFSSD